MSNKHTAPKRGRRSVSRYKDRLAARGLVKAPTMRSIQWYRNHEEYHGLRWRDSEVSSDA